MAKIVNSWNDWDPLKRVIVGRCDNSMIPPEEPATSEKVPVDSEMRGMWGLRPLRTVERGNECLENLVKAVEERGVVVDRPTPLQWNQAIGTPDFRNDSMMTCMPPRDILLTVGNEIMASANSFRCRYFEYLAYWPLMKQYFDEDPDFLWTQAPRPRLTDASYKHNYYDEKITLEERLVRTANKDFVTTEVESTPLVERLSPASYQALRSQAHAVLAPFVTADGSVEAPFVATIVTGRVR